MNTLLFDIFGTLLNMQGVSPQQLRPYAHHIKQDLWSPLRLPEQWLLLEMFPDVREGLRRLSLKYQLATLSNCPAEMQATLLAKNNLNTYLGIIDLSVYRVFKPRPKAYSSACIALARGPEELMMVTANEHFGDLEQAEALGMRAQLIRGDECPDLIHLADMLGA